VIYHTYSYAPYSVSILYENMSIGNEKQFQSIPFSIILPSSVLKAPILDVTGALAK